jgi:DNA-3-methyladenine glycosylase II
MKKQVLLKINKEKLRKLKPSKNYFLSLAGSIISQQISTGAARSIHERFLKLFGKRTPSAKLVLSFTDEELRGVGLSAQKVIYIKDLAQKFIDRTIDPKRFPAMSDQEIIDHLTEVKGIGVWTAHMFLIFALNREDVLPVGDLAIKKGFQKAFGLKKLPTDKKMFELAHRHRGEWTNLSLYLWNLLDNY